MWGVYVNGVMWVSVYEWGDGGVLGLGMWSIVNAGG